VPPNRDSHQLSAFHGEIAAAEWSRVGLDTRRRQGEVAPGFRKTSPAIQNGDVDPETLEGLGDKYREVEEIREDEGPVEAVDVADSLRDRLQIH